jgi:hypothetical protein
MPFEGNAERIPSLKCRAKEGILTKKKRISAGAMPKSGVAATAQAKFRAEAVPKLM